MKDNEIIKALERCGFDEDMCLDCPIQCDCEKDTEAMVDRAKAILDLINRQQAENERLSLIVKDLGKAGVSVDKLITLKDAKSEAIREFENLLINNLIHETYSRDFLICLIKEYSKKMVGES